MADRWKIIHDALLETSKTIEALSRRIRKIEVVSIPSGPCINVRDFGAAGDGVTDDTSAIEAAVTAMSLHGCLIFPYGDYAVSDTISMRNLIFSNIRGNYARIITLGGSDFTNKPIVDFAGSEYTTVENLRVQSSLGSNQPAAAFVLGRTALQAAGYNKFYNCLFYGSYTVASVYNAGDEVDEWFACHIYNDLIYPCYYTSSTDDFSLVGMDGSSIHCTFYGCTIHNLAAAGDSRCIVTAGLSQENVFHDCYFYMASADCIIIETTGAQYCYMLVVDNARVEGNGTADSRFLKVNNTNGLFNSKIDTVVWSPTTSDAIIEIETDVEDSYIDLRGNTVDHYIQVNDTAHLRTSELSTDKNGAINVLTGGHAYSNIVKHTTPIPGNPFTGAGDYEEGSAYGGSNIVLSVASYVSASAIMRQVSFFADGDTTPSIKGFSIWETQNTNPTSITDFDDHVNGQEITIRAGDANTTIVQGIPIKLSGSSNYVMASGGTLTLYYDGYQGFWVEKSRMIP